MNNILNSLKTGESNLQYVDTAAQLMHMAYGDFSEHLFGTKNEQKIISGFKKLWLRKRNRMSYQYSSLYFEDGKPIALLSCYPGKFATDMFFSSLIEVIKISPEIIKHIILHLHYLNVILTSPEASVDEFYISMLAVLPEYQNRGIGTKLLTYAEQMAREQGFKKLSLVVKIENIHALRLYERYGFEKERTYDKNPMHVHKLVKKLS